MNTFADQIPQFVSLLTIFYPLAATPLFLKMTQYIDAKEKKQIASHAVLTALTIISGFTFKAMHFFNLRY